MCGKHQYPPLTVLVVDKEKRKPGGGFHLALQEIPGYEHIDTDNESVDDLLRTRVWSVTNWSELLEAFGVHNTEKSSESSLKALSIGALREQCLAVPPYLKSIETTSIQRYRSPIVQEYARVRANGICQLCESPAPFVDDKGKPFLEVHHIHWLSKGGPDSIFNVVGLCPNCHRRMHVVNDPKDVSKLQLVAKGH
ncbi:HNH endonuclease [Alicyclobacillus curvatus]|nr:HNH endonuclease [Alicyclobacillus curvatus]